MSDVQRYMMKALNYGGVEATPADNGYWVHYADAAVWAKAEYERGFDAGAQGKNAAVAAAEQRGYVRGVAQVENERYVDGMQAARDAVAGLNAEHRPSDSSSACECFSCLLFGEALAAIDALRGESNG